MLQSYLQRFRALGRNARLFLLSNIVVNLSTGAIGLLYTIFLTNLGYDKNFLSVLLTAGIIGAGVGMIPAIYIANRFSARRLLIWSNLYGGVAAAAQLLFPTPTVLVVTTIIVGSSASIYIVLTPPLLAATSTPEERTHLFSINAVLSLLTGVGGSLLGGFLPSLMGSPAVLNSPLIHLLDPILTVGKTRPEQLALLFAGLLAIPSLWPLYLMDDAVAHLGDTPQAGTPQRTWRDQLRTARGWLKRESLDRLLRWPATRFAAYQALIGFGAGLFLTYINLYFVQNLHMEVSSYGILSSVSTIFLAAATLGAPLLAQWAGNVRGTVVTQLLSVPMLIGLALVTNVPIAIVLYLLRGTLMNLGQPSIQSFMMGILPSRERGTASSVFSVSWQALGALGGILSGPLIDRFGYGASFIVAGVCYTIGMAILIPWFPREETMLREATARDAATTQALTTGQE